MPATRLLVISEPKMLNALGNGLRLGGRFEITTAALADAAALAPLADAAEIVAIFYGTRQFPIATTLAQLSPGIRARGAHFIAVLQRDQFALRDACFQAGASDLLFMPMPKEQFVARLHEAGSLACAEESGLGAKITLVSRERGEALLDATVTPVSVSAGSGPPLRPGETVELRWPEPFLFRRWGLVVQSGERGLRVRIAGASGEEDQALRAWVKGLPAPAAATQAAAWPGRSEAPTAPGASAAGTQVAPTVVTPVVPPTVLSPAIVPTLVSAPIAPTLLDAPSLRDDLSSASVAPPEPKPVTDAAPTLLEAKAVPPTILDVKAVAPTVVDIKAAGEATSTPPSTAAAASRPSSSGIAAGPPPGFAARPPIRPQSLRTGATTAAGRPRSMEAAGQTGEHSPLRATTDPGLGKAAGGTSSPGGGSDARPTPPRPIPALSPSTAGAPTTAPGAAAATEAAAAHSTPPAVDSLAAPSAASTTAPGSACQSSPGEHAAPTASPAPDHAAGAETSSAAPTAIVSPAGGSAPVKPADSGLASLFDDGAGTASTPPIDLAPLPGWPTPLESALARSLLEAMLREKALPADAPVEPGAAVRKVVDALPSTDREALGAVGPDSHLHEALSARVLLVHANTEGTLLAGTGTGALVDDAAFAALIQTADAASKRLQAEADRAIAKGEVETLQQVTAASAALSRELLAFKETADRLRGLAAAPRLGAGGLDPHVVAPDAPKPVAQRRDKDEQRAEQRKLALSDFTGLQDAPKAARQRRWLLISLALFAVSLVNTIWFALPGVREAPATLVEQAGPGVLQLILSNKSAIVTVAATWVNGHDRKARLRGICETLEAKGIQRAAIFVDGKGMIGQLEIDGCRPVGLPLPKPPPPELGGQQPR